MARRAPVTDSTVRRMSSSRACVSTMMVTSSGMSFCSMRSRAVGKSVSDAEGKPISISLRPTAHSVLNRRFLVSRLMGSNSAWLPSRRSVLHHTGTVVSCREGHCRFGRSTGGYGRYFLEGSLSMGGNSWQDADRLSPSASWALGVGGFQSCQRRLVARVYVRRGRKKQETEQKHAARCAAARRFVLPVKNHVRKLPDSRVLDNRGSRERELTARRSPARCPSGNADRPYLRCRCGNTR